MAFNYWFEINRVTLKVKVTHENFCMAMMDYLVTPQMWLVGCEAVSALSINLRSTEMISFLCRFPPTQYSSLHNLKTTLMSIETARSHFHGCSTLSLMMCNISILGGYLKLCMYVDNSWKSQCSSYRRSGDMKKNNLILRFLKTYIPSLQIWR